MRIDGRKYPSEASTATVRIKIELVGKINTIARLRSFKEGRMVPSAEIVEEYLDTQRMEKDRAVLAQELREQEVG